MNTFSRFLAAVALIATASASAQNWTKSYPYANWNSTGNDFMHAPSLIPGDVLFVSDRADVDHGKIAVKRCGKFTKPYSVFRGHGTSATQITDPGTERWAGVPVFSPEADYMAVPQWNTECNDGVAGIELLLYQAVNEASDLAFDGKNWKLVQKVTQPKYTTAHQPRFAPNKPQLIFSAELQGGNADLFTMDLSSKDFISIERLPSEINTSADEVYPTYWGDTLLFSRSSNLGLDVVAWDGTQFFSLPEITNSKAHDFNLWVHSMDSAWINTRRDANHSDLWVLVGKKKVKPAEVKKSVESAPVPMDEVIYAGTFDDVKNAEKRAAVLATNPALKGQVSVEFNGTSYVVVVTPPKGDAAASLASVQSFDPTAAITKIPVQSKALELEIYFDFDKDGIRPGEAKRIREFLAQVNASQGSFEFIGHCDSRGTTLYNLNLGLNRSKSVKHFIEKELGARINSLEFSRSEWDLQEPCPDGVSCPDSKHERNRRVVLLFR